MVNSENIPSGKPDIKSLLALPGLTPPYKGIMDEINREYRSDSSAFLNNVKRTLYKENPSMCKIVENDLRISPVPEYSQKWALTYYEIFSRSGRKAGLPLACFVDEKRMDTIVKMKLSSAIGSLSSWSLMEHGYNNALDQINKARFSDERMSDELIKFWGNVDEDARDLKSKGRTDLELEYARTPLLFFQEILQKHEHQYVLSGRYLDIDPLKDHL